MSGSPSHFSTAKLHSSENMSETLKIATAAKYFPSTMSKSPAGIVSNSSSVPWRRSSAQMPIVIDGIKTSMIIEKPKRNPKIWITQLSWSKFARLLLKKSGGQNADAEHKSTNTQINKKPAGLAK